MEIIKLTIAVVTYGRVLKWIKLMWNLRKVYLKSPSYVDINFLFIEDSKSRESIMNLKLFISALILPKGVDFVYKVGSSNLGMSRDIAVEIMNDFGDVHYFGFIDDDDYYDPIALRDDIFPYLRFKGPDIVNFGMSGNMYIKDTPNPQGTLVSKDHRFRLWDDKNSLGCIPSMACFIKLIPWIDGNYKFGYNPPSEETSVLMSYMNNVEYVVNVGVEAMFRNRGNNSLVKDLSIYSDEFIELNVIRHIENFRKYVTNEKDYENLTSIFRYNYGSYLKSHGANPELVDFIFNKLGINKVYGKN